MSNVHKVTLVVDDAWLDAVRRLISYVEGLEVAQIDEVEPAGIVEDYFTAEQIAELTGDASE
jgi:hypothetical protein